MGDMDFSVANVAAVAGALALFGLVIFGGARWLEPRLLYHPDPTRILPSDIALANVREIRVTSFDGAKLVTWHAPAEPGRPTLLYFHGNGGHLAGRADRFAAFQQRGIGVYMMAYRGYSGSEGGPSEAKNHADARHVYDTLIADGMQPADIFLFGESLGTGIAVHLAHDVATGGVVLDSPYTSIVEIGARAYPFLPVRLMMRDRYESNRWFISKLSAPILIVHGGRDGVVPVEMGKELFAMATAPKKLLLYPDAGHVRHAPYGSIEAISDWVLAVHAAVAQPGKDAE